MKSFQSVANGRTRRATSPPIRCSRQQRSNKTSTIRAFLPCFVLRPLHVLDVRFLLPFSGSLRGPPSAPQRRPPRDLLLCTSSPLHIRRHIMIDNAVKFGRRRRTVNKSTNATGSDRHLQRSWLRGLGRFTCNGNESNFALKMMPRRREEDTIHRRRLTTLGLLQLLRGATPNPWTWKLKHLPDDVWHHETSLLAAVRSAPRPFSALAKQIFGLFERVGATCELPNDTTSNGEIVVISNLNILDACDAYFRSVAVVVGKGQFGRYVASRSFDVVVVRTHRLRNTTDVILFH